MVLQASRYIWKLLRWANKGKQLHYPFAYINRLKELEGIKGKGATVDELLNIEILFDAMAARAGLLIKECGESIANSKQSQRTKDNELFAQAKMKMVRAHMTYLNYYVYKSEVDSQAFKDKRIKPIMYDLVMVCCLKSLIQDCGAVFDAGFFVPGAWKNMNLALDILIKRLRP